MHHREFVALVGDPEDYDVVVTLPGLLVEGVGARVPEEDERLAANLVDRLVLRAGGDGDMGHAECKLVHVFDPGRSGTLSAHSLRLDAADCEPAYSGWRALLRQSPVDPTT